MKKILNPGASPRGWHRLQLASECLSKYAHTYLPCEPAQPTAPLKLEGSDLEPEDAEEKETAPALLRGSLIHLMLGQHYMRMRSLQQGTDPEEWATPQEALEHEARERGASPALKREVQLTVEAYIKHYFFDSKEMRILGAEELGETTLGNRWRLTGRQDLVYEDVAGRVFVMDHKCLPGAAEIEGISVQERVARGASFKVRAFAQGRVFEGQAQAPTPSGVQPVWELSLANGSVVPMGDNHPVWSRRARDAKHNSYGAPDWYRADALSAGDEVAVALGGAFEENGQDSPSAAECWVVGALLSDGALSHNNLPMTKADPAVRAAYAKNLDVLGIAWREQTPADRAAAICFRAGGPEFLRHMGLDASLSAEKRFPPKLRALSRTLTGVLLGALWSGDGAFYVSYDRGRAIPRITYGSRSRLLAADIQQALLRLGIPAVVQTTSVEYKGERRPYYYATVVTRQGKQAFCDAVRAGVIPLVRQAVPLLQMEDAIRAASTKGEGKIEGDVWWVKVRSNTLLGTQECFDIEVPHYHTFAVSSVITHNTSSRVTSKHKLFYAVSGQLLGYARMGYEKYKDRFGGIVLNLIQTGDTPSFSRLQLPRSPNLEAQFEARAIDIEESIERLVQARRPYTEWPKAMSELTCYTRYGPCKFIEQCRFGPGAQKAGNFKFEGF